jgi:hypothetical protein
MTRPTYPVRVEREDRLWVATVENLPVRINNVTDVEHFADLEREVRDFVATITDVEPDAFDLAWHYVQGESEYTPVIEQLREWEGQAALVEATRDRVRTAAAQAMKNAGLPLRAIGDAVGLSHQRIEQLLKKAG